MAASGHLGALLGNAELLQGVWTIGGDAECVAECFRRCVRLVTLSVLRGARCFILSG